MDGYAATAFTETEKKYVDKLIYLEELHQEQNQINQELGQLTEEIQTLPEMPVSLERWANSFSSDFKMADYSRMFFLRRRFRKLMDDRQSNGSKIRLFAIDAVLEQIKETIGEDES